MVQAGAAGFHVANASSVVATSDSPFASVLLTITTEGTAPCLSPYPTLVPAGLFWRLLSWFFLLTWLAPLLLLPLIQRQQAAQAERVRQAYEEELRRQQRARSPFGSSMDDLFGNLRGQQQRQQRGGRGGVGGDGPVIDVSWSTIDDDK